MAIVEPNEMDFSSKNIIMIISGLPGTGKSTLALSAPGVLLIDADEGMCRVNPHHRKTASVCKTFAEVREDVQKAKGKYQTIVVDTGGALVDMLKQHVVDHPADYKGGVKNNGGISLQGFGFVKQLFLDFSAELRRNFNVIFIFHENMTRNGDDGVFYELACEGSARTLVYQPADLAAHLFIQNGQRYLGFTPTEQYSAKSAYGISGLVPVPELREGDPNDFLTKLFDRIRANLRAETETLGAAQKEYEETMQSIKAICESISKPEHVNDAMTAFKALPNVLTSEKEGRAMLKKRIEELGIVYNKENRTYEWKQTA